MDRLVALLTNPWLWYLIATIVFLPLFLKYIRRFYSEKAKKEIEIYESWQKSESMKKMNKVTFIGWLFFSVIIFLLLIFIEWVVCGKVSACSLWRIDLPTAIMLAIAMTYIFHRRIGSVILKDNYEVHRKKWIAFIRRKEEYEMTDKELKKTKIQEIIALIIFALSIGYLVQGFIVLSCVWKTLFA
jgi:Ca2+/Na+ antiporter